MGADLSRGDDFCAFTFLFPLADGRFGVKTQCYITEVTLMKLPGAMRTKYEEFLNEGSLFVMEGATLDVDGAVYDDLDKYIEASDYNIEAFGFDPYNAKEFVARWTVEHGPFGIEKVSQGVKTESVPLGEIKTFAEERMLLFDQSLMSFTMGNCVTLVDTNGGKKLLKKRQDQKIDSVAALMDAYIAYKSNKGAFD
jgi:phage terminase large subunit-like protein